MSNPKSGGCPASEEQTRERRKTERQGIRRITMRTKMEGTMVKGEDHLWTIV